MKLPIELDMRTRWTLLLPRSRHLPQLHTINTIMFLIPLGFLIRLLCANGRSISSTIPPVLSRSLMQIRKSTRKIQLTNLSARWINIFGITVVSLQAQLLMVDDPETYHGGPVAVQIVGRRLHEEQVLEMAETVSVALHK